MRKLVDSLFGRLALLVVSVLLISHFAWFVAIRHEHTQTQVGYAVEESSFLIEAVRSHLVRQPDQPLPPSVRVVSASDAEVPAALNPNLSDALQRFVAALSERLPEGSLIRLQPVRGRPVLWVQEPGDTHWIVVPMQALRTQRGFDRMALWLGMIFTAGVLAALLAAWQLQEPLRMLARAVERFGRGLQVAPLRERGPRELRQLAGGFNRMVQQLSQAENDRAVMLAGVAHDLRTPLARLRLRAEMLDDEKLRDGVVRDVDAMAQIVDQFLDFAHGGLDRSERVAVDAMCARLARTYRVLRSAPPVQVELTAGPGFQLPAATLERVVANLLDNAHAYGAAPVVLRTALSAQHYVLTVYDHGPGIAPEILPDATRPFVRLDPARGGSGHSGLGLAIVERLVKRLGGHCEISNRAGGGLSVALYFPAEPTAVSDLT